MPSPCSRRRILRGVVGSLPFTLAGCVDAVTAPSECSTPPTSDDATNAPGDGFPAVSVSGDSPPTDHDVRFDVYLRRQFTTETPAEIGVRFTNLASTERLFQFAPVVPFTPDEVQHTERDAQLQIVPTGDHKGQGHREFTPSDHVPSEPDDSCWQAETELDFVDYFDSIRLDSCESVSQTYAVVGHPTNEDCLPRGRYRAESEWWIGEGIQEGKTWGFTITVGDG